MTSRERFLASLRGGAVDRFFRYEHGPWPTTRQRWIAEGLPPDAGFAEHFDMDPLVRITINSGYTDSPYHPKFDERTISEDATRRIIVDADGITKEVLKTREDTSMPRFVHFPIAGPDDWPAVRDRLDPGDAGARIGDADALARQCADPDTPTMLPICGAFGHPRNLMGDEGLAYALYDAPALIDAICDNWRDLYVELLGELTGRVRVDSILIWEDMCYRNGPLIDPRQFERFMLPRYRELIEAARGFGVSAIIVDTDGDCRKMIPIFLDADVDCLMPFEVQAGMDVVEVAREFPQLSIMGGLDKRALAKDRAAIRAEVDRVLPHFLGRGRFFPTLDHTVPPDVPLANFRYYLDCVRSYE